MKPLLIIVSALLFVFAKERTQGDTNPLAPQQGDQTHGVAPQAERVGVALGAVAEGEVAIEVVEAVGQGEGGAQRRGGQGVAGEARLVVLLDGEGHAGVFTVKAGEQAAHMTLQLGELAHHRGAQIGLAEEAGPARLLGVGAKDRHVLL